MSRWRETLCGSVILSDSQVTNVEFLPSHQSQVLSCGGSYLPHINQTMPVLGQQPIFVNLPKSDHEILVCQPGDEVVRYRSEDDSITDELEMIEMAFNQG